MAKRGGRPTKYDRSMCESMIAFFDREPNEFVEIKDEDGNPTVAVNKYGDPIRSPCRFPTFEGFAKSIGVHRETLLNWAESHAEFFDALKMCKDLQKDILIQNGLVGAYDKTFAIFTAKCVTDMRENTPVDDDSRDAQPTKVVIQVRDARRATEDE